MQTFLSPLRGLVGTVAYGEAEFYRGAVGKNTVDSEFSLDGVTALPRVDIVMAHENMDGAIIDAAVAAGAKGVVIAGVGNGNMTKAALDALAAQAKKGVVCVRSSRVATGRVGRNVEVDDDKLGLVASDDLNPQKARVLLRLALLKPRSLAEIQRLFVGVLRPSKGLNQWRRTSHMRKLAIAAALALASTAAFAQDVKTDFDHAANFAAIKTFQAKIATSWNNSISEKRVLDEITQALTEKGWKSVDANPDALVLLHGATEKQKSLNTFYSGGGYGGYGYRGWGGWAAWAPPPPRRPSTSSARWSWTSSTPRRRGSCSAAPPRTSSRTSPRRTPRSCRRRRDKMFKDFPPGSKEKK